MLVGDHTTPVTWQLANEPNAVRHAEAKRSRLRNIGAGCPSSLPIMVQRWSTFPEFGGTWVAQESSRK